VAVGRVDHDDVDPSVDQGLGSLEPIFADAHGRAADQPPQQVLRGVGEALALLDVLDGDQAVQVPGIADDEQLLDAVFVQELLGAFQGRVPGSFPEAP
jgi:hypothetical protein